jgi:hypothetical protein
VLAAGNNTYALEISETGVQSSTERYSDDHPHLYRPLFRSLYLDNHGSAERTCARIREHTKASATGVPSTHWRSREVGFHSGGEPRCTNGR